jgi:serine/threonine-protein kinase
MDTTTLNEILSFMQADFVSTDKLPATGQRIVFHGLQISSGEDCILKICPMNPINVARIQREIRILGNLDSEYFPKLFYQTFITDSILLDFYDSFDTRQEEVRQRLGALQAMQIKPFLLTAEEYIDHIPWENCIEDLKKELTLVDFLGHLFQGLSLLWGAQVAHRDLKPDNILLRADLKPVIVDLGIAKSFRPGTQEFTVLQTPCTPRYAAPEQLTNTKTDITYKTDQFSVGVIAFLILTGQFPYGDVCQINAQILDNFSQGNLVNIRDHNASVSEQLAQFIEKLLQVHPYRRFRNIETIIQKLNEIKESLT